MELRLLMMLTLIVPSFAYSGIFQGDPRQIVVEEPSGNHEVRESIARAYRDRALLNRYIVGMPHSSALATLADLLAKGVFKDEQIGAILKAVSGFEEGEIGVLRGHHLASDGDIVIGRYPDSLIGQPDHGEIFTPDSPALQSLTKWLRALDFMSVGVTGAGNHGDFTNDENGITSELSLKSLAASISANHYFEGRQRSGALSGQIVPDGATGNFDWAGPAAQNSLWISAVSGWLGAGYGGTYNLEENQLGMAAIGAGGYLSGWKNYVQVGASLSVVTSANNQLSIGGVMSITKDRTTLYRHKYNGEYDPVINYFLKTYQGRLGVLTDKIAINRRLLGLLNAVDNKGAGEIKADIENLLVEEAQLKKTMNAFTQEKEFLSDKHFIEVTDVDRKSGSINLGQFVKPISVGLRGGAVKGVQNIYRFYTPLDRAHELLEDGNGDKIALLRIPKEFDRQDFPDLRNPSLWHVGETLITSKDTTLHGSIVLGLGAVTGIDVKAGLCLTVTGTFEIGVRKLPGNIVEVTFKPKQIRELGGFIETLNSFGPQAAVSSSVAVAMRQTYIFDFNNENAKREYLQFINAGILPYEFPVYALDEKNVDREAEYILDMAAAAKRDLATRGISLVYLEKIDVPSKKFYIGAANLAMFTTKHWAGLSYEYLAGSSDVISTNGEFALLRSSTYIGKDKAKGIRQESEFVDATVKRVFAKGGPRSKDPARNQTADDAEALQEGYSKRFQGLTIRAYLGAKSITGNEQNEMVEELNSKFFTNLGAFPPPRKDKTAHHQGREVWVERDITPKDLDAFNTIRDSVVSRAASHSGMAIDALRNLVGQVQDKPHAHVADLIQQFVRKNGKAAVAAIHLMLDGSSQNLLLRTTSTAYSEPLEDAVKYEALYSGPDAVRTSKNLGGLSSGVKLLKLDHDSPTSLICDIFENLRNTVESIDQALVDLYNDPMLADENDLLQSNSSNFREKKVELRTRLLASKNRMLELMDLESQGFGPQALTVIYGKVADCASLGERIKRRKFKVHAMDSGPDLRKNLDIKQRYHLLAAEFGLPIAVFDKPDSIGKRWRRVHRLLADIAEERAILETKETKLHLGEIFVTKRCAELEEIEAKAKKLISFQHLGADERRALVMILKAKHTLRYHSRDTNHQIAGYLEGLAG